MTTTTNLHEYCSSGTGPTGTRRGYKVLLCYSDLGTLTFRESQDAINFDLVGFTNIRTNRSPALATLNNRFFVAWVKPDNSLNVASSDDGKDWGNRTKVADGVQRPPALGIYKGSLYVIWADSTSLYIMSSNDGVTWESKTVCAQIEMDENSGAAMIEFKGKMLIACVGLDSNIHIVTSTDGMSFASPTQLSLRGQSFNNRPSLAVIDQTVHIAWLSLMHYKLLVSTSQDGHTWEPAGDTNQLTEIGPYNSEFGGRLLLSWAGAGAQQPVIVQI